MLPIMYTDSTKVLGVLGLSVEDIAEDENSSDVALASLDMDKALAIELELWLPAHNSIYVEEGLSISTQDRLNSDCLVLYSTHYCAAIVADAGLRIMSKESDGQNEYTRLGGLNLTTVADTMRKKAAYYRQTLADFLVSTVSTPTVATMSILAPAYDPVTG